jgi:hypothetical protein
MLKIYKIRRKPCIKVISEKSETILNFCGLKVMHFGFKGFLALPLNMHLHKNKVFWNMEGLEKKDGEDDKKWADQIKIN